MFAAICVHMCMHAHVPDSIKLVAGTSRGITIACTIMILIAATLYLAAARHDFCAPAKLEIWYSYIWQRGASIPAPEKATKNKKQKKTSFDVTK